MAFLIYDRKNINGREYFISRGENFRLAGYNLIYSLWEKNQRPINKGWHIAADDIIKAHFDGKKDIKNTGLLIDFDPNSKIRIGLVELLDIYIYNHGHKNEVDWTVLMLKLKQIFYVEPPVSFDKQKMIKKIAIHNMKVNDEYKNEKIEFLYLQSGKKGWNWGSNGRTNAAFVSGDDRNYFRKFF
jgi:hypothetical protein